MLVEQLRQEWRARRTPQNFQAALRFNAGRLELGAGTVLAKTGGTADAASDASDQRLTALLSVAYGPVVAAGALGHVRAAIARRKAGDTAAADLHLALSRLGHLRHPEDASRRLFMADGLMRGGVSPQAIMDVLQEGAGDLTKYPGQPRVPAGNGRPSGQWTNGAQGATPTAVKPAVAAPSRAVHATYVGPVPVGQVVNVPNVGELGAGSARALARFIAAIIGSEAFPVVVATGGVAAVLGVLFIPSTGPKGRWVKVGGPGDLSYYQNPDELQIKLKYTTPDGIVHVKQAAPGLDDQIRTPEGRVVGRIVKVGTGTAIMVSTSALGIEQIDEPQLCPAPKKDRYLGPLGKAYEDYMKARFNPLNPTPNGMAYYFYNPKSGKFPAIDDCQQQTGALAEYKGPNFEKHMFKKDIPWRGMLDDIMNQSAAQASAAGARPITWYFAEKSVADYFRPIFAKQGGGRENIRVEWVPMPEGKR